jgi:peptidoglycan hydrolase-like protein with peptidoglycan-binding domain
MPYTNSQKKQHIRELQTYLHAISYFDSRIPQVIPDGFYGRETALAVKSFQEEYGLPVTGNTDSATWDKIVEVYRSYQKAEPIAYNVFPSSTYVMKIGDKGTLVYILQAMLNDIGEKFDNMPRVSVCGNYNSETADAVKMFQKKTGLPQSGNVNSGTWNMLVRTSEHMK